jgi:hypothetical protein
MARERSVTRFHRCLSQRLSGPAFYAVCLQTQDWLPLRLASNRPKEAFLNTEPPVPPGDAVEPIFDIATSDPEALTRLLKTLIPIALQQLQESFGLRTLRVPNELEAEAALWSACSSFQSHWRASEFEDAKSPEELAAHLLRIACNRAQRRRRQDNKIGDATRRWTTRNQEGQTVPVDPEDSSPGPVLNAFKGELAAYLRKAIDSIIEELQGRRHGSEIIQTYLKDMEQTQNAIADKVGVKQWMVSRRLSWFHDRIRQMLAESGIGWDDMNTSQHAQP